MSGRKYVGTERSPKARVDRYHASHAVLLRQLLSKAMTSQMVLQNDKSIPVYEDFYLGMLQ